MVPPETLDDARGGLRDDADRADDAAHLVGEVLGDTPDATFAVPTTAAIAKGDMYVVNAQFNRQTDPILPFTVSRIDVP